MKQVLVGTDGSVSGQAAVCWAAELAAGTGSELLVATVWLPSFADLSPEVHDELRDDAARVLEEEWCAPARDAAVRCEPVLLEGDPRHALLHAARERGVDLLAVGVRSRGSHPHVPHLGSVAHHLIRHVDLPLAAIPSSAPSGRPTRILVGVDGSDGSARAVAWCRQVSSLLHAEVLAVHAEVRPAERVPDPDAARRLSAAAKACAHWAEPLTVAGIATRTLVVGQEPVTALIETAVRERAGLIVVGRRGRSALTGPRLGSTALELAHHGGLPVVLVP